VGGRSSDLLLRVGVSAFRQLPDPRSPPPPIAPQRFAGARGGRGGDVDREPGNTLTDPIDDAEVVPKMGSTPGTAGLTSQVTPSVGARQAYAGHCRFSAPVSGWHFHLHKCGSHVQPVQERGIMTDWGLAIRQTGRHVAATEAETEKDL
jgi:hypothetical protein